MNPAGLIVTYMTRQDWQGQKFWIKLRTMLFNLCLFIYQLTFIIVGTVWGKFKWDWRCYGWIDLAIYAGVAVAFTYIPRWWNIPTNIIFLFMIVASLRNIPWRRVWRAAQASHVRLCLQPVLHSHDHRWQYINFGYPEAEMQYWHMGKCDGNRFRYYDPTFEPSDEFIAAMIEYANKQVGKQYDTLQLFSFGLNFIFWLWPPFWGKEKLKWLNLRGGREVCSSGVTACLRDAEHQSGFCLAYGSISQFFFGYDTAMVSPCLIELDKNWRKV